eukprot:GILJ01004265.1.p1 GENE.GILJ01004265.1~~GILJ01004265.1.p1  ORF type:complete len:347 (-),score=38.50 GILJ01004265.1:277-1317(-)
MRPSLPTTAASSVSEGLTSLQANYFPASFSVGSSGFPSEFHALFNAQQAPFQTQNWALQSLPSAGNVPVNVVECISQLQAQIVDIYHLIRQQDLLVKSLSDEISNVREYILHPQTRGFMPLVNSPRSAFAGLPSPLSCGQLPVPIATSASQNVLPAMRSSSFDEAYKESPPSSKRLKTDSLPTPAHLPWPPSGSPQDTKRQLSQPTAALVSDLTIRPISELSATRKLAKGVTLARATSSDAPQATSSLDMQSETKPVVPLKKSSSFPVDSPRGIQKSLSMPTKLPLNASASEDKTNKRISLERTCSVCGSKSTPRWRWAEDGTRVCNACGLAEIYKKKKIAEFESL